MGIKGDAASFIGDANWTQLVPEQVYPLGSAAKKNSKCLGLQGRSGIETTATPFARRHFE
jgi:hypothetical protein